MSKVVHLTQDAHARAKEFCERHGLKMSHWVAELIAHAAEVAPAEGSSERSADGAARGGTAEKLAAARAEGGGAGHAVGAPPFWADTPAS